MIITKEMIISDVLMEHHLLAAVFSNYGLYCSECAAASKESISDAADAHDVNLEQLLIDLNLAIK